MNKQFHTIMFSIEECQSQCRVRIISCILYYFDESDLSWSFLQGLVVLLVVTAVRLLTGTLELSFALLAGCLNRTREKRMIFFTQLKGGNHIKTHCQIQCTFCWLAKGCNSSRMWKRAVWSWRSSSESWLYCWLSWVAGPKTQAWTLGKVVQYNIRLISVDSLII